MMPWKCPPLHLPNWNNLWKWKEQMNAKEFAHELEKAASFIRQQQAEIEALKSVVYWLKENRPEVWEDIQKWRKYEPKR
jgi:glutaredoxin 2